MHSKACVVKGNYHYKWIGVHSHVKEHSFHRIAQSAAKTRSKCFKKISHLNIFHVTYRNDVDSAGIGYRLALQLSFHVR